MKKLALLCCLLLACACARQPSPADMESQGPEVTAQLEARWQKFLADAEAAPLAPYRLQMSLRFGTEGDTRRVTTLLWGNSGRQLRLDVMAGVGAVVAKILEDGQHFLVYSPGENKAYFYQGQAKPLLKVGVPVPFDLTHLSNLLNGHYAAVFGTGQNRAVLLPGDLARYDLEGKPGGSVTLDPAGLPVAWREDRSGKGWSMEVAYDDAAPPLPRRLTLTHTNGKRAILLVKEREKVMAPFTEEQMSLILPESAPLLPLGQYRAQ